MAMPRPSGKALRIATAVIPGLRTKAKDSKDPVRGRLKDDIETRKILIIENGGRLPKKNR